MNHYLRTIDTVTGKSYAGEIDTIARSDIDCPISGLLISAENVVTRIRL
jgi:hypothetical protein